MAEPSIAELTRRAQRHKRLGHHDKALETLDHAVRLCASQLADLHGIRGGTLRAAGRIGASIAEYDRGHLLETGYGTGETYCALNRLLTRLTHKNPAVDESRYPVLDIDVELAALQASLTQRMQRTGQASAWVAGDLALVAALRSDRRSMARALTRVDALPARDDVRNAYHGILEQLAAAGYPWSRTLAALKGALHPVAK
jgi:tetratricopeptide (TPR) repeat protein